MVFPRRRRPRPGQSPTRGLMGEFSLMFVSCGALHHLTFLGKKISTEQKRFGVSQTASRNCADEMSEETPFLVDPKWRCDELSRHLGWCENGGFVCFERVAGVLSPEWVTK